jgi:hypothetical protein
LSINPHSAVILANFGGKPFHIVEIYKSSTAVICAIGDFAKVADANCGMWVNTLSLYNSSYLRPKAVKNSGGHCNCLSFSMD